MGEPLNIVDGLDLNEVMRRINYYDTNPRWFDAQARREIAPLFNEINRLRKLLAGITVEIGVRCAGGGFERPHFTNLAAAWRYARELDSGHDFVDCGPHTVVSRFCTPWQEEEAQ